MANWILNKDASILETKRISISRSEQGKYSRVFESGDEVWAEVTMSGGKIVADRTYSDAYLKDLLSNSGSNSSVPSKSKSKSKSKSDSVSSSGEDEEYEPQPLDDDERYWLERNLDEDEKDTPHDTIQTVVNHFFKVDELEPEISSEIEWKKRKKDEFLDFMFKYPTPSDPVEFFKTLMILQYERTSHSSLLDPVIFGGFELTNRTQNVLITRMEESAIVLDNSQAVFALDKKHSMNTVLNDPAVRNVVWDISKKYHETEAWLVAVELLYRNLVDKGDNEALATLLGYYVGEKHDADKWLEKFPIPNNSKEEFIKAFDLITQCSRQKSSLKAKIKQAKKIIETQYPDEPHFAQFLNQQMLKGKQMIARTYNIIKWVSFAVTLFLSFFMMFIPTILWAVLFYTSLTDKIPFLKNGKAVAKELKNMK